MGRRGLAVGVMVFVLSAGWYGPGHATAPLLHHTARQHPVHRAGEVSSCVRERGAGGSVEAEGPAPPDPPRHPGLTLPDLAAEVVVVKQGRRTHAP